MYSFVLARPPVFSPLTPPQISSRERRLVAMFNKVAMPCIMVIPAGARAGKPVSFVLLLLFLCAVTVHAQMPMVSFTFDDGLASPWTSGQVTFFEQAALRATWYPYCNAIDKPGMLTQDQLMQLASNGHEIGNHTFSHKHLTTLSAEELHAEINGCTDYLARRGFPPMYTFAYPFGEYNSNVIAAVQNTGLIAARTIDNGVNVFSDQNFYELRSRSLRSDTTFAAVQAQIDAAVATRGWYIMTIHDIDHPNSVYSITSAMFQQIVNYVVQLRSQGTIAAVTIRQGMCHWYQQGC